VFPAEHGRGADYKRPARAVGLPPSRWRLAVEKRAGDRDASCQSPRSLSHAGTRLASRRGWPVGVSVSGALAIVGR
jgi:hypothetical protein